MTFLCFVIKLTKHKAQKSIIEHILSTIFVSVKRETICSSLTTTKTAHRQRKPNKEKPQKEQ